MINNIISGLVETNKFELDKRELYARLGGKMDEAILDNYINKYNNVASYRYAYVRVNVVVQDNVCKFDFAQIESKSLSKVLTNSNEAIILAVTSGLEVDRFISKTYIQSKTDAFIYDAIASAEIESFADYITNQIKEENIITNRFSPGYADLSLEIQQPLLDRLNATKLLGISLSSNFMMIPKKSITAIIGIR